MLTRGLFLGLTEGDLKELKRVNRNTERRAVVASWEETWDRNRRQDTDKAWKMLFYVLREPVYRKSSLRKDLGSDFNTQWLADIIDLGGELFYGPNIYKADSYLLSLVDKRKLPVLNAHLRNIDPKLLDKRLECCLRYWLADRGIKYDTALLDYLNHWLQLVQDSFSQRRRTNGMCCFPPTIADRRPHNQRIHASGGLHGH